MDGACFAVDTVAREGSYQDGEDRSADALAEIWVVGTEEGI